MLTLDKVFDASNVLKEVIRPTACIHAPKVNPDCDVYLKTENLQVTGSFKVRGAYYKISDTYAVFKNNESDNAVFTVRCRSIDSVVEALGLLLEGRMPTA